MNKYNKDDKTLTEYERGLNDAWYMANKIVQFPQDGGFRSGTLLDIFGKDYFEGAFAVLRKFTVTEAMEKIKEWKDKICVGDVVKIDCDAISKENSKGIVMNLLDDKYIVLMRNGYCSCLDKKYLTKTDRKVDISKWLKEVEDIFDEAEGEGKEILRKTETEKAVYQMERS